MTRTRTLASFEDDFEMRRHADATLRLQRISTMLISQDSNGALYEHVLDAAIDLMSADMGSMQVFHSERGELRLLAEKGFNPGSAAHFEWVRPDSASPCGMALSAGCRVVLPDIETCEPLQRRAELDALRQAGSCLPVHTACRSVRPPIGHDFNPLAKAASPHRTRAAAPGRACQTSRGPD
jgi:hypothetical protein